MKRRPFRHHGATAAANAVKATPAGRAEARPGPRPRPCHADRRFQHQEVSMQIKTLVYLLALFTVPSGAAAQDQAADRWQPMTYHDFQTPSVTDPLQSLVWPDVIREANAYVTTQLKRPLGGNNARVTALASTYRDGARTIIVSTALSRDCDSGANSSGADIEPSVCPLRVVTIENGKVVSIQSDTACYTDHADQDVPAKNRNDNSYTRFDPVSRTLRIRTTIAGRDVPTCAREMSLK
jgi:hypothetical protein